MTTCRDIVTRAYRMAGIIGLSESPETSEAEEGLVALQSMFDTWVAGGMFGRLTDVYKTAAYTAREGERVHTSGSPTITIPSTYAQDGEEGTDRTPYDLSLIEVQDGATRNVWVYDRSAWVDLKGLTLSSTCPFAERGESGLAACLAITLADTFGAPIGRSVSSAAAAYRQALSYKLGSERPGREQVFF